MKYILALLYIIVSCNLSFADTAGGGPPPGSSYMLSAAQYWAILGVEYVATTNTLSVPAGDTVNIKVCNTYATGGKTLYVYERRFDNNNIYNDTAMSFGGLSGSGNISDSATYSSATAAATTNGNNMNSTLSPSTGMTMTFAVGTARLSGTVNGGGNLLTDATPVIIEDLKIIPPNTCFAQYVTNPTGALGGSADNITFTFHWWEQ